MKSTITTIVLGSACLIFSECNNSNSSKVQDPSGIWLGVQSIYSESGRGGF